MKSRMLAVMLGSAVLGSSVIGIMAEVKDNPYQVIVTRNAFALKPPPPPAPLTPPEPPPSPVDVLLTGISTLGGTKKALLQVTDKSPSKAGKTEFPPPLVEGDVQGRIEVVSIDPEKGTVLIKIDGNEKTLTFDRETPKTGPAPPPGVPGAPGMPMNPVFRPGVGMPLPPPGAIPAPVGYIPPPASAGAGASGRYGVIVGGGGSPAPASVPAPTIPGLPVLPTAPASQPGSVTVGGAAAISTTPAPPAYRTYRPAPGVGGVPVAPNIPVPH